MLKSLDYYLNHFKPSRKFLNVNKNKLSGIAPHKPILLLAIIENISAGIIKSNRIYASPELIESFKKIWSRIVYTNHTPTFPLPFYHLKSSSFWKLIPNLGFEYINEKGLSISSYKGLRNAVDYAILEVELYELMKNEASNEILKQFLLNTYFSEQKRNYYFESNEIEAYVYQLEQQLLVEDASKYLLNLDLKDEELLFKRSSIFKKQIPILYQYHCCISEMNLTSSLNVSMIDACHIVPFSKTHNDHITNGIALCPNLHRAFDRGLLTIDTKYRVVLSTLFKESLESTFQLNQFDGKKILLPNDKRQYPKLENLSWHNENVFQA